MDLFWLTDDQEEITFREELLKFVQKRKWDDFDATRQVFCDWLEERQKPEALLARLLWTAIRSSRSCLSFRVERQRTKFGEWLNVEGRNRRLIGCINFNSVLGFAPGTLRLQPTTNLDCAIFTWKPERDTFSWYDVGAVREGFAALFS